MVPLPRPPRTRSPVPELTSIHGTPGRGPYGDPGYRGNCSGLLIRDLFRYYQPRRVLDPMSGSGTCRDVCRELGIAHVSHDLKSGVDATSAGAFAAFGRFDFIWIHPPYWKMIRYGDDPRCLSNASTLSVFLGRLRSVVQNCLQVLAEDGKLAILIGDYRASGEYLALPFRTVAVAFSQGLTLDAPEIIRFQHGATSSDKEYPFAIIPRLHDVCFVFRRANAKR